MPTSEFAPKTQAQRLPFLEVEDVVADVETALRAKARDLAALLGIELPKPFRATLVGRVRAALAWAKEGAPKDRQAGVAALRELERALYGRAVDPDAEPATCARCHTSALDATTPAGLMLAAGRARLAIEGARPSTTAIEVAALAGVHPGRVGQLLASGEIAREKRGAILPASARAWLASRGVPGVE